MNIKKAQKQFIICSAIHITDNITHLHQPKNITSGFVICGRRHHNCFQTLAILKQNTNIGWLPHTQGFITNDDLYLNRQDAFQVALKAKKLINPPGTVHTLTSEDLW